ncbi:bifunctional diguanylate cyclase/phosphodiesterase [Vibrio gangliei]|uniref:bifunctional diguanylate cyclase/phosphodiesterase n=1 Tax=Vibrio gangliei TaxID=2077090 RepID=UPI00147520A5|nr:EAL domain-containing protein [Vibrio gangliei]
MKAPRLTLRTAIILPLTLILLLMSGVIYVIQSISYENTLNEISRKELTTMSQTIKANLADYLYPTFIISSALSQSVKHQFLAENSTSESRIQFIFDTYNHIKDQVPQLDMLNIGLNKSGYYYGFRREANQSLSLLLKDETTQDDLVVFSGTTTHSTPIYRVENYDMHPRPWFAPVVNARKQMWSEPYINNDEKQDITLSALTPVLNNNELYGVIAADIRISTFNKFLTEQKSKHSRSIFIFDSEQRLIAQSENINNVFSDNAPKTEANSPLSISGGRRSIFNSKDPSIKATAQAYVNLDQVDDTVFSYVLNKKKQFAYVTSFRDDYGLDWHIAISIPESEVLSKLSNQQDMMNTMIVASTLILCLAGFIFLTRVTSPITQTAKAAQKLAKREWTTPLPVSGQTFETYSLVKSFNDMASDLQNAFTDLHKQLAYDSLTQLYSREGLIEAVQNIKKLDGFVFVIGFDNFRDVNDSLGYLKGDQLLTAIAQRIKHISPDTSYHARIGGSEFAIVIPFMEEGSKASFVSVILKAFATAIPVDMENILLAPSIGVSQAVDTPQVEQWLRQASIALSHAKKLQLKDATYSVELEEASLQRTKTIVQITEALKHHEFEPFYQPLIDLKTNKIVGAEALARWLSPTRGLIPPFQFIPVAEESGLILQIGQQILMKACQDTQNEIDTGRWPKDFHLHVNIAVAQLASEQFIYDLKHILEKTQITPHNLTLEVVESNLIDDETVLKNINDIRALGVGIAVDDFGTGYSSLAYLQTIPFDCLKIDRAFISPLTQENYENSIAAAILSLMKDMKNVTVVAEGIETAEQAQILAQLGCEQVQGFYYGRPTPIQEWATQFPLDV